VTCETCRWFEADLSRPTPFSAGRCYARPPVVVVVDRTIATERPLVHLHDRCAEWKDRRQSA